MIRARGATADLTTHPMSTLREYRISSRMKATHSTMVTYSSQCTISSRGRCFLCRAMRNASALNATARKACRVASRSEGGFPGPWQVLDHSADNPCIHIKKGDGARAGLRVMGNASGGGVEVPSSQARACHPSRSQSQYTNSRLKSHTAIYCVLLRQGRGPLHASCPHLAQALRHMDEHAQKVHHACKVKRGKISLNELRYYYLIMMASLQNKDTTPD